LPSLDFHVLAFAVVSCSGKIHVGVHLLACAVLALALFNHVGFHFSSFFSFFSLIGAAAAKDEHFIAKFG
jgi:hypothetical protein